MNYYAMKETRAFLESIGMSGGDFLVLQNALLST